MIQDKLTNLFEKSISSFYLEQIFTLYNDTRYKILIQRSLFTNTNIVKLILIVSLIKERLFENKKNDLRKPNLFYVEFKKINLEFLIIEKDKIVKDYINFNKALKIRFPLSVLKSLIYVDNQDFFIQCLQHNFFENNYEIKDSEIKLCKENHILFSIERKIRVEMTTLPYWDIIDKEINEYNILLRAILSGNEFYLNSVLKINDADSLFFEENKTNVNVFHLAFSCININILRLILEKLEYICKKMDINFLEKISYLLNQVDSRLLIPVDCALKNKNFNALEFYSNYLKSKFSFEI